MKIKFEIYKPIFIVGLHRTGSTLFKNMINRNSEVAMATDEMDFSDPWYRSFDKHFKRFGDLAVEQNRRKLIDFVFEGKIHGTFWKEYRELGISRETILKEFSQADYSLKSLITILLEAYRNKENKNRVGVKYPVHISRLKLLFQWFPDAKIIFLIRDARAIIASKLNDEKTRERKQSKKVIALFIHYFTLLFFIIDFIWATLIYRKYKDHPNFIKIRYEDLVANPNQSVMQICDFCDIPFEPEMFHVFGKASSHTGEVTTGFDVKKISYWKNKLGTLDKILINFLAYPCMYALGYGSIEKEYIRWNSHHEQK